MKVKVKVNLEEMTKGKGSKILEGWLDRRQKKNHGGN